MSAEGREVVSVVASRRCSRLDADRSFGSFPQPRRWFGPSEGPRRWRWCSCSRGELFAEDARPPRGDGCRGLLLLLPPAAECGGLLLPLAAPAPTPMSGGRGWRWRWRTGPEVEPGAGGGAPVRLGQPAPAPQRLDLVRAQLRPLPLLLLAPLPGSVPGKYFKE